MAEAGIASRRHGKKLVADGRVRVNGQVATGTGTLIDPQKDVVEVDHERAVLHFEKVYILLNKPSGYLSTTVDTHDRRTVMDLLPSTDKRIYPVGRLDMDTEGLLIITNDGPLTYQLTHPKHHVDKVYLAWVKGYPSDESLDELRRGIMLDDVMTAPAVVERENSPNCLRIIIHEGRKRQVRKMCWAIGHNVRRLKRIQVGPIHLGDLEPGDYRYLSNEEVELLRKESNA